MPRFASLLIAWALGIAALGGPAGCDGAPEAPDPAPEAATVLPPSPPTPAESHARMLRELAAIAAAREEEGAQGLAGLREEIARAPEGDIEQRIALQRALGTRLLQLGDTEASIAAFESAWRLLGTAPEIGFSDRAGLAYQTAVAHLRKGEVDNCTLAHNADRCLFPIGGAGIHERKEGSRRAIEYFERVLSEPRAGERRLAARWLLNIAQMTVGGYPHDLAAEHVVPERAFRSDEDFPRFLDVAPQLGLAVSTLSGGVVADDLDGDGFRDILVSDWHPSGQIRLFRRQPDGSFIDDTEAAGLLGILGGLNLVQADFDDDGDVDVLVLRGAWHGEAGRQPNSLLRNEGDGRFVDVAYSAGLAPADHPTQTAAWADYDNDGDLDLYVGNETDATDTSRSPCQLFRNEGDGTFVERARAAGVENFGYTKGVAWGDYDADGDPDLYVSNMGQPNRLYRNEGDGTFVDVAAQLGVDEPIMSFPVWFWDYDNDGALDLYVSAYTFSLDAVVDAYLDRPPRAPLDRVYRGDGKGGFEDVAPRLGLRKVTMPMGANFGDLDNDGFLDFYLGTGYPAYDGLMPNLMFYNRAGVVFSDVTTAGGFGHLQKGHAIAFADLDNDGDQDVFAEMGGAYAGDVFMNALFENPGFGNHWIEVVLEGTRSNRSGLGARIRLDLLEDGRARSIHREVGGGSSFGGNSAIQEIGLGRASRIEVLEVFWPASGIRQRFEGIPADRAIGIREGDDALRILPHAPLPFAVPPGGAGHVHDHAAHPVP